MHLDHDGTMSCTHSIAEVVTAVASEARRRDADYVRVAWDDSHIYLGFHDGFHDATVDELYSSWPEQPAMANALRAHDPFQNGEHMTLPAWYVGRQLAYALGSEIAA